MYNNDYTKESIQESIDAKGLDLSNFKNVEQVFDELEEDDDFYQMICDCVCDGLEECYRFGTLENLDFRGLVLSYLKDIWSEHRSCMTLQHG